jgi:chromosome segregation ATPase
VKKLEEELSGFRSRLQVMIDQAKCGNLVIGTQSFNTDSYKVLQQELSSNRQELNETRKKISEYVRKQEMDEMRIKEMQKEGERLETHTRTLQETVKSLQSSLTSCESEKRAKDVLIMTNNAKLEKVTHLE